MDSTHVSLLERLRKPGQPEAWARFVELYTPLLLHWARRLGLQPQDAADFVQEVFTVLVQKLPAFTYDHQKSFRSWLRTVSLNKWRDCQKRKALPVEADPDCLAGLVGPEDDAFWEREFRQQFMRRALEIMKAEFQPAHWQACWESVVCGRSGTEVARELGMTENAVYIAKYKVLRRLRQEFDGLLDKE